MASGSGSDSTNNNDVPPPPPYSNEELTQMLIDMKIRYAGQDKKLMSNQFDLEAFSRRQEATNRKIEESLSILIDASLKSRLPDAAIASPSTRGWKLPSSLTQPPTDVETEPLAWVKPEAPPFNGDNAADWIRKIQRYFNHHFTPLQDRIHLSHIYLITRPLAG